jgi:hypothetical protein
MKLDPVLANGGFSSFLVSILEVLLLSDDVIVALRKVLITLPQQTPAHEKCGCI